MNKILLLGGLFLIIFLVFLFQGRNMFLNNEENMTQNKENDFAIKSSAFKYGEFIPIRFTGDGDDVNPLLEIKNVPEGTKSLVLIFDDPDAFGGNTWVHWVLWNINPETQYIAEDSVPEGATVGLNSWGKNAYGGPYPPKGSKPHRYFFKLYALDIILDLPADTSIENLYAAMKGHIIAETSLMGLYGRK